MAKKAKLAAKKTSSRKVSHKKSSEGQDQVQGQTRVVEVSASMRGAGLVGAAADRAEAIERAMNDAYNSGLAEGISDQGQLLARKIAALQSFLDQEAGG